MDLLGYLLLGIGVFIALVYSIRFIIVAFQTSILWGLGCLLVPPVSLIFLFVHWKEAKLPFLRFFLCIPFFALGYVLAPHDKLVLPPNVMQMLHK